MSRRFLMLIAVCLTPFVAEAQTADPGQQVFSSVCAACHGLDGQGGEHAPNIATDPTVQSMTDREITGIVRYGIQSKGMPAFQSSLQREQISAVVKYLRVMGGKGASRLLPGDASRGKTVYFGAGRCSECHTMIGKDGVGEGGAEAGGFLGADLSGYGSNHSAEAIRTAIIDPNKNPDLRHGTVSVTTRTGVTYTGIARNEDNFTLQMQTADGKFHFFEKRDLARLQHDSKSLMPADYGEKLSAAQLDDLVKFLSLAQGSQKKDSDDEE